ncbi:MAG: cell division protein FtsQ/DivIB [Buchnera aphidicola (Schlechtendalia peitan)]
MSKQFSKKKLSNLVITGQLGFFNKQEIETFILSFKKPNSFFSKYEIFIQEKLKTLPFVKTVLVKKIWPDKLFINMKNTIPIAYWNNKYILDETGTIYNVHKKINAKNFLYFYGPKDSQIQILNNYHIVKKILKKNNIVLKSIVVTSHNSWKLLIENNTKIIIGNINNIMRLKRLVNIWKLLKYEETMKKKQIKYIDLRYESGIAIGWK